LIGDWKNTGRGLLPSKNQKIAKQKSKIPL
jgi:hypothetical protein